MWSSQVHAPLVNLKTDPVQVKNEIDAYNEKQKETMQLFDIMMKANLQEATDPQGVWEVRQEMQFLHHGRRPPEIHSEFSLPKILRSRKNFAELAHSALYRGFLNASSHPWMIGWTYICGKGQMKQDDDYYIKRYQGIWRWKVVEQHPELFQKVGAIIMEDPDTKEPLVAEYHRDLRTHFSNAPSFDKPPSQLGPTHVAIGFNDLQFLLPDAAATQMLPPLRCIGYDRSTYSIAKTMVLLHMLRTVGLHPHHIVEAWYSSTWTYETLMFFRASCLAIVSADWPAATLMHASPVERDEVLGYLEHWAYRAIPATDTDAAARWFLESCQCSNVYTQTCSFHRPADRAALLNYFMTGEFGPHCFGTDTGGERVASMAMFSVPEGSPVANLSDQDRVNNTIPMHDVLNEIRDNGNISIMEAMYNIKIRQIRLLQQGVQSGQVQVDLRYGDIKPRYQCNAKLLHEIRDWNADTISWSNLVDYFVVSDFHELAQFWSTNTTTHFGYTMNWPTIMYGAHLCDYQTAKERKKILVDTIESAVKVGEASGLNQIVTAPSFEHTEDVASDYLGRQLYPFWVKYFRQEAQSVLQDSGTRLEILQDDLPLHTPISRTSISIYLSWQYR